MMSQPGGQGEEGTPVPDFAVSKVEPTKKKSAKSTVEDLERRLAMLGAQEDPPPALPEPIDLLQPAPEAAAPSAPEDDAKPALKGGKNALLARIMAAQERTKQTKAAPAPPPALPAAKDEDLLMDFDAPPPDISTVGAPPPPPPPPAYDTSFIPPPSMAAVAPPPPTFDMLEQNMNFPAPPPMEAVAPPPPMESFAPSAPAFEDLMEMQQRNEHPAPMQPPPLSGVEAVPPPAMDIDEDVLGALDPEERAALLEEQRRIMEQIEANKVNDRASSAAARALAFDQRSAPAVARAAGVTSNLSGPVSQGADSGFAAVTGSSQMDADMRLAEQLQQEEYKRAGGDGQSRQSSRQKQPKPKEKKAEQSQSWYDWFMGAPAPAPAPAASTRESRGRSTSPPRGGLLSAHTGEERRGYRPPSSFDGGVGGSTSSGGTSRVEEPKSMFAYVADSMSTAVTSMTAPDDPEGVDKSSLLAMPQVTRRRE